MTHKITDIVAFIRHMRKDNPAEAFEQSQQRLCARFPGLTYGTRSMPNISASTRHTRKCTR
jgi:hypothetical protein